MCLRGRGRGFTGAENAIIMSVMRWQTNSLTFDIHGDPLADRRRHTIGRDAEISAHFVARDPRQV